MISNAKETYKQCLLRQQIGSGQSWGNVIFRGRRGQRGFGFGSILGSIGKLIIPAFKRIVLPAVSKYGRQGLKRVGQAAIEGGLDIISKRKTPKKVLSEQGKKLSQEALQKIQASLLKQKGRGRKRKRKTENHQDIFAYNGRAKKAR